MSRDSYKSAFDTTAFYTTSGAGAMSTNVNDDDEQYNSMERGVHGGGDHGGGDRGAVYPYAACEAPHNANPVTTFNKSPPGNFWKGQNGINRSSSSDGGLGVPNLYPPGDSYQEYQFPKKISLPLFINKTLNYVIAQLFVTFMTTFFAYIHKESVNNYIQTHSGILWIPIILSFVTLLMMYCSRDKYLKKTMFCLFTLSISAMVAASTIQYSPKVIMNACATLFLTIVGVNMYAKYTAKKEQDLSFMGPTLFGCLSIVIVMSIINIFIKTTFLKLIIAILSVIVFTALLLYDLNRLYMGADIDDDILAEPMVAAINIYLDIINIFLNLLSIFGGDSK